MNKGKECPPSSQDSNGEEDLPFDHPDYFPVYTWVDDKIADDERATRANAVKATL